MTSRAQRYQMSQVKRTFGATAVKAGDDQSVTIQFPDVHENTQKVLQVEQLMKKAGFKPLGWANDKKSFDWSGDPSKVPSGVEQLGVKVIKASRTSRIVSADQGDVHKGEAAVRLALNKLGALLADCKDAVQDVFTAVKASGMDKADQTDVVHDMYEVSSKLIDAQKVVAHQSHI